MGWCGGVGAGQRTDVDDRVRVPTLRVAQVWHPVDRGFGGGERVQHRQHARGGLDPVAAGEPDPAVRAQDKVEPVVFGCAGFAVRQRVGRESMHDVHRASRDRWCAFIGGGVNQ